MVKRISIENETWKWVDTKMNVTGNLSATGKGDILLGNSSQDIYRMTDDGKISQLLVNVPHHNFLASDSSEQLYLVDNIAKKVFRNNNLKKKQDNYQ
jgi:hypothetical protein